MHAAACPLEEREIRSQAKILWNPLVATLGEQTIRSYEKNLTEQEY